MKGGEGFKWKADKIQGDSLKICENIKKLESCDQIKIKDEVIYLRNE